MKINLQKLAAIEERARQKWVVMNDIHERLQHKKSEWQRQRWVFIDQIRRTPLCETLAEALERHFYPATVKGHRFEQNLTYRINEINAQRTEVDRLNAEHQTAQENWQAANACLNVLRDFAARYGKSSTIRNTVLGGETAKPAMSILQGV